MKVLNDLEKEIIGFAGEFFYPKNEEARREMKSGLEQIFSDRRTMKHKATGKKMEYVMK